MLVLVRGRRRRDEGVFDAACSRRKYTVILQEDIRSTGMEETLPKCLTFGELVGGAGCLGGQGKEE